MADSLEDMLGMLLTGAVETLDISPDRQALAVEQYEDVGTWLAEHGRRWEIYAQGSAMLGTVVRPAGGVGDYDIDLVCRTSYGKADTSQAELKREVGDQLDAYLQTNDDTDGGAAATLDERRRCWTLGYRTLGFHLDVLPAIPDEDHGGTGICLTDRELTRWQYSNPLGYAAWFRARSTELQAALLATAEAKHIDVADVPTWHVRRTLQRVVQVLKWHAMMFFRADDDTKPPSILITTLAGRAYDGGTDLFSAARAALGNMQHYVEKRGDRWWVENPAHPSENFADKWSEHDERRRAFWRWHTAVSGALDELGGMEAKGLDAVVASMSRSFAPEPIVASARRLGEATRDQRVDGRLRVGSTGLLGTDEHTRSPGHTFHGAHPDPRG